MQEKEQKNWIESVKRKSLPEFTRLLGSGGGEGPDWNMNAEFKNWPTTDCGSCSMKHAG